VTDGGKSFKVSSSIKENVEALKRSFNSLGYVQLCEGIFAACLLFRVSFFMLPETRFLCEFGFLAATVTFTLHCYRVRIGLEIP